MSMPLEHVAAEAEDASNARWAAAVVVIVTIVVMGRICGHEFLWWDDQGTLHRNTWINHPSWKSVLHYWKASQFGLYFPVTGTLWVAIASIAQVEPDKFDVALNPWFFHAASVIAHLTAALLAFRIFRLLNASALGACCGALTFAIHPVQVEAVAWASGFKDVLTGLFAFAALLQYIRSALARDHDQPWVARYILALVFFILAVLSKGSAISLPLAALAIDRWGVGRPWRAALISIWPWIAVTLPLSIIVVIVQAAVNTPVQPLWLRPLIACDSLAFYFYKLIWPAKLMVEYGRNPATVVAHGWLWWDWIVPVGIGCALWLGRVRRPVLLAAYVIFIAGCLPTIGLTVTLFQYFTTVTDHYLYTAMLGPALAVAWLLSVRSDVLLRAVSLAVLAIWGILAFEDVGFWQNDFTLFHRAVDINPNSYVAYGNLGSAYARYGDTRSALIIFQKAIDANPEYALSYSNLGHALFEAGDIDDALTADERSIALQIKYPIRQTWARDNREVGEIFFRRKQYADAEQHFLQALMEDPNDREIAADWAEAHSHTAATTRPATTRFSR